MNFLTINWSIDIQFLCKMKTKSIRQVVQFDASPSDVFDLLMNERKYSAFSGSNVKITKRVGEKFNVFDGYCTGVNLEIIPDKRIVQSWNFVEDGWPADHFTTCSFDFEHSASGTKMKFVQTEVPDFCQKALADGWKEYFWEPMKTYLKNHA